MTTDKPSNLNTRFDIHICLVSGQPTPNLTPVLASGWKPETVVLIVSPQQIKQAQWLKPVIERHSVKCEIIEIADAFDIAAIHSRLEELLEQYKGKSIAFNVTGGTKPMAIAAQGAAYFNNQPYFYVNYENNEIQLHTDTGDTKITPTIKLTLRDYLNAHGYSMSTVKDENNQQSPSKEVLMQNLVDNAKLYSKAIGHLNWLAKQAEDSKTFQVTVPKHIWDDWNFERLLNDFKDAGLVKIKGNTLLFSDEEARFFANGGWLEDYVFGVLENIAVQDYAKNIDVISNRFGSKNELDIAFLAKNRLHLIECKTKKFEKNGDTGRDTLYKLDSLTDLGGLNTKAMLVSFRELDRFTLQRAKDLQVIVIDAEKLRNLEKHIKAWISQ